MAEDLVTSSGSQISSNTVIAIISSVFILIILYPWIIAVTIVCFIFGFTGLEHLDKLLKQSIISGRLGNDVQERFKDYISITGENDNRNMIKQVTADPLSNFVQENEQKDEDDSNQKENEPPLGGNHHPIVVQSNSHPIVFGKMGLHNTNSLVIPGRHSNSSRSSPEKNRTLLDSPKRSLSAASSRRVSEDIPGSTHSLVQPLTTMISGVSGIFPHHSPKRENTKSPSPSRSSTAASSPSPSISLNPDLVGALQPIDQDFRVDIHVDKAIGRLCTNIINYYISPSWAPYETRKQLKLSFKQLLKKFGERCCKKMLLPRTKGDDEESTLRNAPLVKLTKEKLLPLAVYYMEKILDRGAAKIPGEEPILTDEGRRRIIFKIRKFCRQIFDRFLEKDDKKCKLWVELCVAVLADGVLVNVMELGRDKLPELLEVVVEKFKKSCNPVPGRERQGSHREAVASLTDDQDFIDPLSEDFVEAVQEQVYEVDLIEKDKSKEAEIVDGKRVPFLLDSFLDPPFNLEKPDPIVSRWRPTLKDIVSETDLLYPLIQYMKHVGGQQSLAYLQGVLDEYPHEGDAYCRRVLELEYLPGFCRSSLFLETMGLSRVEMAMEVGTDPYSMVRRNSNGGHARSASYGGPSSNTLKEFWKIEQGIVDGLPLTESSQQNLSISSSSSDQLSGGTTGSNTAISAPEEIQPSLAFKRRPHLEMYIAKFIKSTSKTWQQYYDPLADPQYELAKRAGIDAKSYEEWDHPDVTSRVEIDSSIGEIYDSLCYLVTSLMRECPIASPFVSGLASFLKPYLMPLFGQQLDQNLTHALSKDLLITVVDLIADVYEPPNDEYEYDQATKSGSVANETDRKQSSGEVHPSLASTSTNGTPSEDESHEYHNSFCTTCDPSFKATVESILKYVLETFMTHFVDLDYLVKCFVRNREYIFLFFVDLLDVLVMELVEN